MFVLTHPDVSDDVIGLGTTCNLVDINEGLEELFNRIRKKREGGIVLDATCLSWFSFRDAM